MRKNIAFYGKGRAVNAIFWAEKGKFLDDLRRDFAVSDDLISGHEGKEFRFQKQNFLILRVKDAKFFWNGKPFALYEITIVAKFVLDGEAFTDGKDFLLDIKLHNVKPP